MKNQRIASINAKIRFGFSLVKAKLSGRRIPLMANLLITSRCNLKCFYCYVDATNRKVQDIEESALHELIDTLYARGTRLVVLLGGEPLLYNNIGDIIRHIKKKGMVCELITNGYFVSRHLDALSLCDSVCVSLDGDRESHDHNRGVGSYDKAVEAIRLLKEKGIPTRIKAVFTRNNQSSLDFLCRFAQQERLMLTVSTAAIYDERVYSQNDRWLDGAEKKRFIASLYSLKKRSFPVGYSFTALNYMRRWPYPEDFIVKRDRSNHRAKFRLRRCLRKDRSFYVDSDGRMYPCAYLWGKGEGNILTDGFDSAWDQMARHDCYACGSLPDIDITLMFNCNPENIIEAAGFYWRSKQ